MGIAAIIKVKNEPKSDQHTSLIGIRVLIHWRHFIDQFFLIILGSGVSLLELANKGCPGLLELTF